MNTPANVAAVVLAWEDYQAARKVEPPDDGPACFDAWMKLGNALSVLADNHAETLDGQLGALVTELTELRELKRHKPLLDQIASLGRALKAMATDPGHSGTEWMDLRDQLEEAAARLAEAI